MTSVVQSMVGHPAQKYKESSFLSPLLANKALILFILLIELMFVDVLSFYLPLSNHLLDKFSESFFIFSPRSRFKSRVEVYALPLGMVELLQLRDVFRSYTSTEQKRSTAMVVFQDVPSELSATAAHRIAFGIKE